MRKKVIILFVLSLLAAAAAQGTIIPTNFLNTAEPERLCNNYVHQILGPEKTLLTQPSGGALVRMIDIGPQSQDRCLYIFCDAPTNRLLIFSLTAAGGVRTPGSVKFYGLQISDPILRFYGDYEPDSITMPRTDRSGVGCFDRPVDVAVSSCGRYFDPQRDFIYVLDQGNHRIVRLSYDIALDSLIWVSTMSEDKLKLPTAIDYAEYGDNDKDNDDLYVTDAALSSVIRFSKDGVFETSYGGWGSSLADISYPTGVAVSTSLTFPKRIYVTDSHNHRVVRYYSDTVGPIIAESQYIFPLVPWPLITSVDTDSKGSVYVLNNFTHNITVFKPGLDSVITVYGSRGYDPGQFDFPWDIYIDNDEMQVCEWFADSSGIQSFLIQAGSPKVAGDLLPDRFYLYQNYPNPFNSNTTIRFDLPSTADVEIAIYNILGQRITTITRQNMGAGAHNIIWNATNQSGERVSSGVYFYRLRAGENVASRKLLLLK